MLFGAETLVLLAAMAKKLEGVHVGFLWLLTGMKSKMPKGDTWQKAEPDSLLQGGGGTTSPYLH